jgi:hypothetical protein
MESISKMVSASLAWNAKLPPTASSFMTLEEKKMYSNIWYNGLRACEIFENSSQFTKVRREKFCRLLIQNIVISNFSQVTKVLMGFMLKLEKTVFEEVVKFRIEKLYQTLPKDLMIHNSALILRNRGYTRLNQIINLWN